MISVVFSLYGMVILYLLRIGNPVKVADLHLRDKSFHAESKYRYRSRMPYRDATAAPPTFVLPLRLHFIIWVNVLYYEILCYRFTVQY
jgi:hypothetical protein